MDVDRFDHRGLALAISAIPGLSARLLAEHVAGGDGRCQRCSIGAQAGWHRWPCRIHCYAAAAAELDPDEADPQSPVLLRFPTNPTRPR